MRARLFHFLRIILFFIVSNGLFAQTTAVEVSGKVVDHRSRQPIEYATVIVKDNNTQEALAGVTTGADGSFQVATDAKDFYVEVSFLGFETQTIDEIKIANGKATLGVIDLSENSKALDEVVVRAEKSTTEFKLDKRVFNVGKDLSSTGASALEVLNNVPSVNVNIEGQVSLRGSTGVQILINGKPSVIASESGNALGTITADMIEQIEVITNPSAKHDAEGTSGIINIIIKKEEREGINGSASINIGTPHNHSAGLSLNRRTEHFNLFSQLGAGYRELPQQSRNTNRDLIGNTTIFSEGTEYRNETFFNFILGTDYHINEYNVLTLSGNFAYEIEDQPSRTTFSIPDNSGAIASEWYRTETTEATNPKYQYELQYKKQFRDKEEHTLLFSAVGNFFGKDQSSEFENINITGNDAANDQHTRTNFKEGRHTFNVDYTKPFSEKWTLETGAQYLLNDVSNDFAVSDLINGELVQNENLTNIFEYTQNVLGVYGTGAYEGKKWGVKAGLRVENTDLHTFLVNTGATNDRNFTNLFPTLHTSYKLTERFSMQAGYSRRIFRPRLWDLNPFFNIRNNYSVRTGNPDLLPEFTDSYELSSIYIFGQLSLNASLYYRHTTDVVERVSSFENNVNTVMPLNIGTNRATGFEFNFKYETARWLSFNGDFNLNYFNRQGSLENTSFDFSGDQWSSKLTAKLKLPAGIDFEATGQYQSRVKTVQSEVSGFLFADFGLRKKILKGKGVFSFSVRDAFASRIRESVTDQANFYLYNWGRRGRFVTLGFSYGFGKGEAMEYSGQRRHF
ncbi:MAG: outer membrane beta-barrel family protein [Saprospiraceae bacterium]